MGLDMYLTARKYVSHYSYIDNPDFANNITNSLRRETEMYDSLVEAFKLSDVIDSHARSAEVKVTVGYWRKANQVHAWFVDNVQNGVDQCQDAYVDRDALVALRDLCMDACANQDPSLLPPRSGFFFGSTEIDEYYWNDVKHTIEVLDKVLHSPVLDGWDFYYESSW